jgi:DNA polymerase I-like protein with 3'-5' exonuclease and polymerase domains
MKDIMRYKQIATLMSKYVNGTKSALLHTQDNYTYGAPTIFGTYTGRYTYSSKTLDTYQTGLALHQIPRRDKEVRSFIVPPEGCAVYEADASGQESRLMAIKSGDDKILRIFSEGLDFHCMTGSGVVGREYDEFYEMYKTGDKHTYELRQMGKLTNLSCNYRIGGKALAKKSFDDYDIVMSIEQGMFQVNGFCRTYRGVPKYWDNSIKEAKALGYTETFGGRRYKLHDWSSRRVWETESAAIMFPIQGSGASMKNICVAEIHDADPDCHFALDLHDASFVWVPEESAQEKAKLLDDVLANIDYEKYWGFKPSIPLPYESKLGKNFSEVK